MSEVKRTRNFMCIIWQESAPEDWYERLCAYHIEAFVSPLHDKDLHDDGTPKKPHWHVILRFKGVKADSQVIAIMKDIGEKGVSIDPTGRDFYVQDFQKALRYHCHLDDLDKYRYDMNMERTTSSKDVIELMMDTKEEQDLIDEMLDWARRYKVKYFATLADYARKNREDWMRLIRKKNTIFLTNWFKSASYEMKEGCYPQEELNRVLIEMEQAGDVETADHDVAFSQVLEERQLHEKKEKDMQEQIDFLQSRLDELQKIIFRKEEEIAQYKTWKSL